LWFGWFWLFGGFGGFWAWWLFVFSCLLIHFRVSAVLYGLKLFCGLGGFGCLVGLVVFGLGGYLFLVVF
jgi:hypothetical protein